MSELARAESAIRVFCSLRTEGRLYGIDAAHVREISTHTVFTPVPQAPTAVRGLVNLRSRVYLVVDIRPILGLAPAACTQDSRLIVLKPLLAENLGILVEQVGDIVRVHPAQIEETSPTTDQGTETGEGRMPAVIAGVCKLDSELMNIIDLARLVESMGTLIL